MLSDGLPQVWHQNDPRVSDVFGLVSRVCPLREGEVVRRRHSTLRRAQDARVLSPFLGEEHQLVLQGFGEDWSNLLIARSIEG